MKSLNLVKNRALRQRWGDWMRARRIHAAPPVALIRLKKFLARQRTGNEKRVVTDPQRRVLGEPMNIDEFGE